MMIYSNQIGLEYIKVLLIVSTINLIGSIGSIQSSLEVELMPGVTSPIGGKPTRGLENQVSYENGGKNDEAFLKLLEEGFNVYEKLKIPGLAEADDLLYDYSEKEKGSRIFFPDFPDIPEIPMTKNETNDEKAKQLKEDDEESDLGDEGEDDETEDDDGDDEEKKDEGEHGKSRSTTIGNGRDIHGKSDKGTAVKLPVDPDAAKMLDKETPFVSHRINVSAEKVPKIMNVETVNSKKNAGNLNRNYNSIGNKAELRDPKIVLLSYGGRNQGKPKSLRPLSKDELRQAMYQHEQQDKIRNNRQKYNEIYNERRKPQEPGHQWKPPSSSPPPWTVSNHKNLKDGWHSGQPNVGQYNDQSSKHQQQQHKPRGVVMDNSKSFNSLLGNDDNDYHRIVVPSSPNEINDQPSSSLPIKQSNIKSNDKDFFEEHILALRSRRHRGKRQVIGTSSHPSGQYLTQASPSPLGLAGLYEGPMVMPLSPNVNVFDELYRRLLLQQLVSDEGQPLAFVEENSYFIPEGISSPSLSPPTSSLHEHLSSRPYHPSSSSPSTSAATSISSSRPLKAPGYCVHGYPGQPYSCRNSFNRYVSPIVHKPGVDEPKRLRDIYLNYLDSSVNHQQHPTGHHSHSHPFHHYYHHSHQALHPSSSQFLSSNKPLNNHHYHHSSDFDHAMSLIPDEAVTFFQPYSSFTLQPHPKSFETLDPISLTQYRDLVNNLHNQVGLGNPSIMSTDIDLPSTLHSKMISQFNPVAARVASSNSASKFGHLSFRPNSKSSSTFSPSDSVGSLQEKLSTLMMSHGKNKKISNLFGKKKLFGSKIDSRLIQLMNKLSEERSKKSREIEHSTGKIIRRSSGHFDHNSNNQFNDKHNYPFPSTSEKSTLNLTSILTSESNQSMVIDQPEVKGDQRLININSTLET